MERQSTANVHAVQLHLSVNASTIVLQIPVKMVERVQTIVVLDRDDTVAHVLSLLQVKTVRIR
jgi:cephalosporin hydroxylase